MILYWLYAAEFVKKNLACDIDPLQNLIASSLAHAEHFHQIPWKLGQ